MHRNKSVNAHSFAMVPRADIPRSSFKIETAHKTTFDSGYIVPFYMAEVYPGDSFSASVTQFARMATPIYPIMDNLHMDTFYFFVPLRLLWDNFQRFMGERDNPDDSIDYLVPQIESPAGGYPVCSLYDYLGLPTVGQVTADKTIKHSALPLRAYNLIYNQWFRDENLQDSVPMSRGDGPDDPNDYSLLRRGKRHDYFTSALPWPQKGDSVRLPLGSTAPVFGLHDTSPRIGNRMPQFSAQGGAFSQWADASGALPLGNVTPYADLSEATAATINQIRQSFQIQRLLERDARGGTRYTEITRSHFGVMSPDARLQRAEYLGGSSQRINVNPIAQTSGTDIEGSTTPLGNLGAMATVVDNNGFSQAFTEHGIILGLVSIRADLTYQQGMARYWSRRTRYDFYFPVFAHLGEQAVLSKEIYCTGDDDDDDVFGYQERWAELRYHPSMITGRFRSTSQDTLDAWHAAQRFTSRPVLNSSFIEDKPPIDRLVAVSGLGDGQQFIFDSFIKVKAARPLPMYSVPGMVDHF